jgi:hypothetical protein
MTRRNLIVKGNNMKNNQTKILRLCAITLMMFSAQSAMAFDFVITFKVPVMVSKQSPKVNGIALECDLFDRNGKLIKQIPSEDCCGWADIGSSHSFNGTMVANNHFDLIEATKTDWGIYKCYTRVNANDNADLGYPSENHTNPLFRTKAGSVLAATGNLY